MVEQIFGLESGFGIPARLKYKQTKMPESDNGNNELELCMMISTVTGHFDLLQE